MKQKLNLLVSLIGVSFSVWATDDITVVALNDFHSQMQANQNMVGAAKISTFLQKYRLDHPNLLLVLAGDNYQGTAISNISLGQVDNEFFNYIGVGYSAIGNHDFDYGQGVFESWSKFNHFPFLAANILNSNNAGIFKYAEPYAEYTLASGKKIAVIGLATLETPVTTSIENIQGLRFTDPAAANDWVKFLNSRANTLGQPDTIILLTHINLRTATQDLAPDPQVEKIINKYYQQNITVLDQVVTKSTQALGNLPDSGLYNIKLSYTIADILRQETHSEIGLQNTYGIRRSLPAGSITYSMVYEAMPFDNTLTVVKIKGTDLRALIKHSLPAGKTQLAVFAGVQIKVNSKGSLKNVLVNGKPLNPKQVYTLATLNFLTKGGDGFDFSKALTIQDTNQPVREVVKQYWLKSGIKLPADWQNISMSLF